jgi:hypothetical protein
MSLKPRRRYHEAAHPCAASRSFLVQIALDGGLIAVVFDERRSLSIGRSKKSFESFSQILERNPALIVRFFY